MPDEFRRGSGSAREPLEDGFIGQPQFFQMVPGNVTLLLLLAFEAVAAATSVLLIRGPSRAARVTLLCVRCTRLHTRTETVARIADGVAVGALAFLVALPFVAAGYESGFTLPRMLLAASVVIAVLAIVAEADFFARAAATRFMPKSRWAAEPARIIGGGARWVGILLALYMFHAVYRGPGNSAPGLVALFGDVGKRLAIDVSAQWTIWTAAAVLVAATMLALVMRWLVPLIAGSLPITFAVQRDARGRPI